MKLGLQLHPDRGVDAVIAEARRADEQGFDSVWLSDHLMNPMGQHTAEGPLDYFVLMTAIAAVTQRTRLAWGMLNVAFRPPALFAKMLASLDQISHGRLICTFGSGWYKDEYEAYGVPFLDHDERIAYTRELVLLLKDLWTHPAPERVTFEGKYVKVRDLPFNPAPYQKPHPPIWLGGESGATLAVVKELADGWVTLSAGGDPEALSKVTGAPDWPKRPMTVVKGGRVVVRETREAALADAQSEYESLQASAPRFAPPTFEAFLAREVVGTPDECLASLAELESWGVNYLRLSFQSEAAQDAVARLLLPRL